MQTANHDVTASGQTTIPRTVTVKDAPDLLSAVMQHRETIEQGITEVGAVLLRGCRVAEVETFEQFVKLMCGDLLEYNDRATKRHAVKGNVYTSTNTSPRYQIVLHNESSFASRWPARVFFYCRQPSATGGRTPLADCRKIFESIAPEIRERFKKLGVMYVRNFGHGPGMGWREVFGVETKSELESMCQRDGIQFEWLEESRLRTRQVRPAMTRHPETGQWVWFNHAMTLHVSSLDPLMASTMLRQLGEENLPNNTYYGDGSPIEPDVVDAIRTAYDEATIAFDWQAGDVLMLDNMQVAHGRESYKGPREVLAAMAEPLAWKSVDGGIGEVMYLNKPPIPEGHGSAEATAFSQDADEALLIRVTAELLELDSVDRNADLLELGADSLTVTRIIAQVFDETGVDLPLRAFFESPTIAQLAPLLRNASE